MNEHTKEYTYTARDIIISLTIGVILGAAFTVAVLFAIATMR